MDDAALQAKMSLFFAEAMRAHGLATSPAAAAAAASAASLSQTVVTSRDMPEGIAADFLSNNGVRSFLLVNSVDLSFEFNPLQYYLSAKGNVAIRAEYLRIAPHLTAIPGQTLKTRIDTAVRNARSHISSRIRATLATSLPHTRTADGTVMVCFVMCVCACVCLCVCVCVCVCHCAHVCCCRMTAANLCDVLPRLHGCCNVHVHCFAQFTDGVKVAEERTYRDDTADTPFSSPTFHAVLRTALKGRRSAYTVHDIAFVNFICDAALRQVNLQKLSAAGLQEGYDMMVTDAQKVEGKDIAPTDGGVTIKIISCKTTREKR